MPSGSFSFYGSKTLKKIFTIILLCGIMFINPAFAASDNEQIECMARNTYFEARGESKKGMEAVNHVVMNRTKDRKFPSTPCKVIYQKGQFSWTRSPRPITNRRKYEEAKAIAVAVFNGARDITSGAKYFHSVRIPRSSFKMRIGNHFFY